MTTPFDFLNAIAALEKPDGVIAFPTDTVYGLGCLPRHEAAVRKIYDLKGRSLQKPLILMSYAQAKLDPFIGEMTRLQQERFETLADTYWPGSLTLVLPKSEKVSTEITRHHQTVGMRIPNCELLLSFLSMVPHGVLATTSANRSNEPECTKASMVFEIFGNQLDAILMGDDNASGQPSTVAAIHSDGSLHILRQGSIVLD